MGPFCEIVTTVKDSNTNEDTIGCYYSHLTGKGYVLGSRYRILNYMTTTDYTDPKTQVTDLEGIKALENKYLDPTDAVDGDYTPEYNVNVVAQCQNKYCDSCLDFNLTLCSTCWGRFGDQTTYSRCYQARTCVVQSGNQDTFLTGCYKSNYACDGCEICDTGYVR